MVNQADLEALVRTLRRLLAAVTRILLLADNVVVKQLLVAGTPNSIISTMEKKPKTNVSSNNQVSSAANAVAVANQAGKSQSTMHHFNEFVKAFCDFGSDMVHLIRITTGMKCSMNSTLAKLDVFNLKHKSSDAVLVLKSSSSVQMHIHSRSKTEALTTQALLSVLCSVTRN